MNENTRLKFEQLIVGCFDQIIDEHNEDIANCGWVDEMLTVRMKDAAMAVMLASFEIQPMVRDETLEER